ncbi:MAG: MFS transporter [Rhodobacteraceae bacterium]|nr:MFS transporter [Paracoccaceae bacterium]
MTPRAAGDGPASQSPSSASRIGWRRLAAYAAPMAPLGMLHFPIWVYVAPFYAGLGADLALLGAMVLAARLLDAITDPAMGVLSDRTPRALAARFGRRKPWLALAAPVILFSAWRLLIPPEGAGALHAGLWLGVLMIGWTAALTPYLAWGAELEQGYAARARVTAWRESAGLLGMAGAAVLYATGADAAAGLAAVFAALALALPVATAAALVAVPEPPDRSRRRLPWREAMRAAARNRAFARLIAAWFLNGAANALPAALFLFFVEQRLGAPDAAGPLLILYFMAAVLGAPVWSRLSERFPKHRVWGVAMLWACAVFVWAPLLGPGDVAAFAVITALSGFALGADLALPPAIQADVVDADAAETGEHRAGAFFAAWSVTAKAAQAVAAGLALLALSAAGFDAAVAAQAQSAGALDLLAALYALAPAVLKIAAVALVWRFPIDREAQAALRARLDAPAA